MKKLFTLLTMLIVGIGSMWAVDVKISNFNQPVTKNGTWITNYEFKTTAFSGLADVTITAPNSDFNIGYETDATYGDGWVNATYGYCLKLVTSDTNAHTVQLNAPSGYKIVGYSFFARSNSSSYNHVLTPAGGSSITSTTSGVWVTVNGILAANTTFTIQTQNGGNTLYIPQFTISLVADTKVVKEKQLTIGDAVAFSNIDEIADGTTPVLLYNTGRNTYLFDTSYPSHRLGSWSSSDGKLNTSAAKFLITKSGDNYKIMNYDSQRYIPAWTSDATASSVAVFPQNAATFSIVDNEDGTYGIKDGTHSFNGNGGGYDGFCYWGSGTTGNSAYKIMKISEETDIDYTIPDEFFNSNKYYRIKVAGRGDYYMSAGNQDTYIHLTSSAFDYTGAQVWKVPLSSRGVNLYSIGAEKYVTFVANHSVQGQNISAFTTSEDEACNFIPEDKGEGNYGFMTMAPIRTYLSNNGGIGATKSMGYYNNYDAGGQLQFERVYRVKLQSDMGDDLGYIYTNGTITASDLYDYDYYIDEVAKTKDEVVAAINAVTADDALVIVCSHQRKATISSKAEIDQTKVYSLSTARGWLYAIDASNTVKTYATTNTFKTFKEDNQWAFVTIDGGDTYYLYNVGKKRFLMSRMGSSNFMESKFTIRPVVINTTGNATYPISFKDGSNTYNVSEGNLLIDGWSTSDDGNRYSVQEIRDIEFDPTEAQAAINAMSSNIPFYTSPAPSDGSFDVATTWYNISMRPGDGNGGYYAYVPSDYNYESPANISLESTKGTKSEDDKYRWCITGSIENGYRLYNKAAGADRVFVFEDGGKIKDYSGNETSSLFYLAKANAGNGIGAPTFVFKNTDNRPNKQGNPPVIASWGNSDIGSEFGFVIDEAYDANNFYYIEYIQTVKPFMDTEISSKFFYLPSEAAKTAVWNASRYSDGVEHAYYSHDDVTAMRTTLETRLRKPTMIDAVRLKNNKTGKYASYGQPTYYSQGLICYESISEAKADLSSVLQFIPATASTYYIYMPTLDKYVGAQTTLNYAFPLVDEESRVEFTLNPTNTPGVVYIKNTDSYVDEGKQGCLHSANWEKPAVVNWEPSAETSNWRLEDAETICFDMISPNAVSAGGDVYMTYVNNLGLPIKAPESASVYIVSSKDDQKAKAYTSEVTSKEIPAGCGVIIKAAKGSTVHMDIKTSTSETLEGNVLVAGDGSTTVEEGNFMLAYKSADEIAKFYAIGSGGYVVPANKAYLPATAVGGARTLSLSFNDDATGIVSTIGDMDERGVIYNLYGQKLSKMQKGINIVNGKKVLVK